MNQLLYKIPSFFLFLFFIYGTASFGQLNPDSLDNWLRTLKSKQESGNRLVDQLNLSLEPVRYHTEALEAFNKKGDFSIPWFAARYFVLEATGMYRKAFPAENVKRIFSKALSIAYGENDERLISMVSRHFGNIMNIYGNTELAVMYCTNAAELDEKAGIPIGAQQNWILGEVLYKIREYDKAIHYCKLAAAQMQEDFWLANCVNTIALSYQKLSRYDSALVYYDSAYLYTRNFGIDQVHVDENSTDTAEVPQTTYHATELWKGIISGNKGQVFFLQGKYDKALPLFELDYRQSKQWQLYDNAANSLQWLAKTNLVLRKTGMALDQVREAFYLLSLSPSRNYYQNLYGTAADIYRDAGLLDSALYYSHKYMRLHDSIESEVARSRIEIARIRLENEKNYYDIRTFQAKRKTEIITRNLVIASVLLLAIIALLYMNNLRVKSKHRQEIEAEKSRSATLEMVAAKQQLDVFTASLLEKSNIIDQLQHQINNKANSAEQEEALSNLLQSTILTDEQWLSFKALLEKVYPGFFLRLKENYPGITAAEQRMAALSKLKLSVKEISAMLGISIESVHKTRQRLRQRLQLDGDTRLEDYVAGL